MFLVSGLILLLMACRALYLHRHVAAMESVRRDSSGWLSHEVRRRVSLVALPKHIAPYPVPREVRVRVVRFAGVVLWHKELSIALPDEACSHLDEIAPEDFDPRFPNWLQLGSREQRA